MTDAELLAAIGAAIYGRDWVTQLAEYLGVNRRSVQRWLSGYHPVPLWAIHEIASFADMRSEELARLSVEAWKAAAAHPEPRDTPQQWARYMGTTHPHNRG